ncbi:MAG TPA: hypothetical protein VGB92_26180 [Longimicrobium sp.]|jgi:hypothetical protein
MEPHSPLSFELPNSGGSSRDELEAWLPQLRAWKSEHATERTTVAMLERRERWAVGRLAELALQGR